MKRVVALFGAMALLAHASVVAAHGNGEPWIHVPTQSVLPGQSFELWAADLGPDSDVVITLVANERTFDLGHFTAGADGHFVTHLTLPATVPLGYAQLTAQGDDGTSASTWVFVGDQATSQAPPIGQPEWWADPALLVLMGFLIFLAAAIAFVVLRPKPMIGKRSRPRSS